MSWTNETKASTTINTEDISGVAHWDDPLVKWDDPSFAWDARGITYVNEQKSAIDTFVSTNPFFAWLFYFTQVEETVTTSQWTTETKH